MFTVVSLKINKAPFYVLTDHRGTATSEPSCLMVTISESFQMRYCMTLYFKGYLKHDKSKLNV